MNTEIGARERTAQPRRFRTTWFCRVAAPSKKGSPQPGEEDSGEVCADGDWNRCDKLLVKNFPYIFDTQYTATLEGELDAVEEGQERWTDLLNGFYDHFEEELKVASKHMEDIKRMEEPTNEVCDKCGSPLILKWGKFGSFYSCTNFTKIEADDGGGGALEEGFEGGDEEDHDCVHFPDDGEGDDGRCDCFEERSATRRRWSAAIRRRRTGKGKKVMVEHVQLRLYQGEFCGEAGPQRSRRRRSCRKRSSATTAGE